MPSSVSGALVAVGAAVAASEMLPALPPVKLPLVETTPPADTSSVLPLASCTTGPCSEMLPPFAVGLGATAAVPFGGLAIAVGSGDWMPVVELLIHSPAVEMPAPWFSTMLPVDGAMVCARTVPAGTLTCPSISTWFPRSVSPPPSGPLIVTFSGTVMRPSALIATEPKPVVT